MTMILNVGGYSFKEFTELHIQRALDQIAGTFNFTASVHAADPFPIPRQSPCTVEINGTTILTGYVDVITVEYGATTHTVRIAGRDKTADIVDSKISEKLEFKAPITLDTVIKRTLEDIGATDVKVINKVEGLAPYTKKELVSGKIGMGAFEFIDKYAAKRQVVLTTDGLGNIVVTRASSENSGITLRNSLQPGAQNNIKLATATFDDSERYNTYKLYAQQNHAADPKSTEHPKVGTYYSAEVTDDKVRPSRKYRAIGEGSQPSDKLLERAKWEANIREAKSFNYTATMVELGPYSMEGAPYQPNTLVTVIDDFADVEVELLIVRVSQSVTNTEGSITELVMMSREAFILIRSEPSKDKAGKNAKKGGKGGDDSKYSNFDNSSSTFFSNYNDKRS